jgi:hypothetical protein
LHVVKLCGDLFVIDSFLTRAEREEEREDEFRRMWSKIMPCAGIPTTGNNTMTSR